MTEDQAATYVAAVDRVIFNVYIKRYPWIMDYSTDGTLVIVFYDFQQACWKRLEDKGLLQEIYDLDFVNDNALKAYLFNTFNNILKKMIYDLTPLLETRKKQMHGILSQICVDVKTADPRNRYWRLKDLPPETTPADLDTLNQTAGGIHAPIPRYPKKIDSERGPSIPWEEMKNYLVKILNHCGGAVKRDALIAFIKTVFGIETMTREVPGNLTSMEDDEPRASWDELIAGRTTSQGNLIDATCEHYAMALEIYKNLTAEMKEIVFCREIKEATTQETASRLGMSTGKVSGLEKEIRRIRLNYFSPDGSDDDNPDNPFDPAVYDEIDCVNQLMRELVLNEKELGEKGNGYEQ